MFFRCTELQAWISIVLHTVQYAHETETQISNKIIKILLKFYKKLSVDIGVGIGIGWDFILVIIKQYTVSICTKTFNTH